MTSKVKPAIDYMSIYEDNVSHSSIEAVLCDLDDVVRRWDRLTGNFMALEMKLHLPERALIACAFQPHLLQPVITGLVSHAHWVDQTATALTEMYGPVASSALIECWLADRGEVDADVLAVLDELQQDGVRLVLVTNATDRLLEDLEMLDIATAFDEIVNSSEIGSAKPHDEIYRQAVGRAGVPSNRCVFIDDKWTNVETATALGIAGVVYEDAVQLRTLLRSA